MTPMVTDKVMTMLVKNLFMVKYIVFGRFFCLMLQN